MRKKDLDKAQTALDKAIAKWQGTEKEYRPVIDENTIDYFKVQAENSGIPDQTLINLYLSDCVTQKRELQLSWK